MGPKKDPRKPSVPTPAPADFIGAKKKKPLSAATAAKSAGGPTPFCPATSYRPSKSGLASAYSSSSAAGSPSTSEARGDKRQRNSASVSGI